MQHRFRFLASPDAQQKIWRIEGDEFFHLKKVLRLKVGEELEVFSSDGVWGLGVLIELEKDCALVELASVQTEAISKPRIAFAIGVLQQQTMADLIPCLVELGVDEIHIFLQEGTAKARLNEKTIERWNKIALSALKQCKRARLPLVKGWASLEECLKKLSGDFEVLRYLDPDAKESVLELKLEKEKPLCLFVGSEKGLNAQELAQMQKHGVQALRLGSAVLRAFTAAVAGAGLVVSKRDLL